MVIHPIMKIPMQGVYKSLLTTIPESELPWHTWIRHDMSIGPMSTCYKRHVSVLIVSETIHETCP